jgi:hypothetical protein
MKGKSAGQNYAKQPFTYIRRSFACFKLGRLVRHGECPEN